VEGVYIYGRIQSINGTPTFPLVTVFSAITETSVHVFI